MTESDQTPLAAAIDIGSNSIKMTIGRPDGHGGIEQVESASETVRLGHGVEETGRLDEGRAHVAIATLSRFAARARELGACPVLAVATEATRSAENGGWFLERVRAETGIEARVLDGQEEAELTFRGVTAETDVSGPVVVADIGGGSTELIVARDGILQTARSLPFGSGRLTERLVLSDPPTATELAAVEMSASAAVEDAAQELALPAGSGVRLVIVGGTGEFMARLVPDERGIDRAAVRQVLTRLVALSTAELAVAIAIPEARARVLPAGVAIVAAIAERVRPRRIGIARGGVRAGLLLEALQRDQDTSLPQPAPAATAGTPDVIDAQPAADDSFRETMRVLIAERWGAVWRTIPVALEGTDIEGVHDVRVASRRLRAAMDIAAPAFPRSWYRPLHRAAKEITGALGAVRDRDVLLEALHGDRKAAPLTEQPGIDRLIARIERERVAARVEMERYLRELMAGPLRRKVERRFATGMAAPHEAASGDGPP